jgi:MurNAc alpha-1-phosphate uridylyltransferase
MILAAGRGERLYPLTKFIPKALCKINEIPLIEHHVIKLASAGFNRVVINHAYLGGQIRQHLGDGSRFGIEIIYSPEPPGGLETGGGIVNALQLLGDEPFLVINADIYTDYDYRGVDLKTLESIHLILVNKNETLNHPGDFGLNQQWVTHTNPHYTFSGIAGYHPSVFAHCKPGRYSMSGFLRQQVRNQKVCGSLFQGIWFDIGSLERLKAANEVLMKSED